MEATVNGADRGEVALMRSELESQRLQRGNSVLLSGSIPACTEFQERLEREVFGFGPPLNRSRQVFHPRRRSMDAAIRVDLPRSGDFRKGSVSVALGGKGRMKVRSLTS